MTMEKIIVYPYNDEQFLPVLRHPVFFKDFHISYLVSPKGWGNRNVNGSLNITCDFDSALEYCHTVLISESGALLDFENSIMPKIMHSIEQGKNIICTMPLHNESFKLIHGHCESHGVYFKYFNYPEEYKVREIYERGKFLYDISTPVIFVFGLGERTNKFEIQLSLRENIMNMGYKVSQIGTRGYCELLGFHSMPCFMFDNSVSETDRIVLFNHYVKNVEMKESPDVIIIGVPGAIMALNNSIINEFGILAYEMCLAVTPDSSVLSCYYEDYNEEYFFEYVKMFKYKFGCQLDCFNLSNIKIDWQSSRLENKMNCLSLDSKFIDEKKKKYKSIRTPVFNVLNYADAKNMAELIIKKLCEYGETECI
jgi:peptide maturation system protein (TIGR04066 family)